MPTYSGSLTVVSQYGGTQWVIGAPNYIADVATPLSNTNTNKLRMLLASSISIPSTEIVVGVAFTVTKRQIKSGGTGDISDSSIYAVRASSPVGSNKATGAWQTTYTASVYGGSTDLLGTTWATTDFTTTFGIDIAANVLAGPAGFTYEGDISSASVTVYTVVPLPTTPLVVFPPYFVSI